ncbi:MAG: EamA family transporter [Candidatus Omnitrophota bacterium]|nr:EamA family transporter [Candidatus Omnitrophota bacterium]
MLKAVILIFLAELWNTLGQILFKKGTNSLNVQSLRGVKENIMFLVNLLSKPVIWRGFACMAIGLILWFVALAGANLSAVSPLGSMQYILILIAAHFFLGEKMDFLKVAGTLLVIMGIILVATG